MFSENIFLASLFLVISLVSVNGNIPKQQSFCDDGHTKLQEGNNGQIGQFPWYGVLRYHMHQGNKGAKTALTGIVLIKDRYCIANALDVSKIHKNVLKEDTKAMFIPDKDNPWFAKVKDYMLNPEFDYSSYSTLALVQLDIRDDEWGTEGQTNEQKQLLEKFIQKVQYIDRKQCDEYYHRAAGAAVPEQDKKMAPLHYMCSFAPSSKKRCEWDTGMVLASNNTGKWVLIGFGLSGPGCAAPARFLDMSYYLSWVDRATSEADYVDYRRDTSDEGFPSKRLETNSTTFHSL